MHKLYEWACNELEELESKAEKGLSAADVEYADKLTELKKNILKIEMLEDEGYSAEYRDDMGNYGRGRNRGGSYEGRSYRNSYARGRNARRDSMGRYSRDGYSRAADEHRNSYDKTGSSRATDAARLIQRTCRCFPARPAGPPLRPRCRG